MSSKQEAEKELTKKMASLSVSSSSNAPFGKFTYGKYSLLIKALFLIRIVGIEPWKFLRQGHSPAGSLHASFGWLLNERKSEKRQKVMDAGFFTALIVIVMRSLVNKSLITCFFVCF